MLPDQTGTLLDARDITKTFGVVRALRGVSFSVRAGEVHGLLGENGAGKSTLIKVLTGLHVPDEGEIRLAGRPARFGSPREARLAGVAAVYQEINLIPERSVAENMFLGREPKRGGILIDRARMARDAGAILQRYGLPIDPRARLGSLGLGLQQMVSIARTVSLGARVVILDEPTSALTAGEVDILFGAVRRLRLEGIGLVFVSHRLSECYALCDRLTVLRDGQNVRTATVGELPREELVSAMLGRAQAEPRARGTTPTREARAAQLPTEALAVRDLSWRTRVRGVSLAIRAGEIVGLAGLLGAGRTETMKAVFGAERPDAGTVSVDGRPLEAATPRRSIAAGLGFLSEDRRTEGIFPLLPVRENMTAAILPRLSRAAFIDRAREDALVQRYIAELGVRTAGPGQRIGQLSGGNQQKVLIARTLAAEPRAIMLDDPTRGIDVGAKEEVHRLIRRLADEGLGVLVTSSELEELIELCDRLVVLSEGAVVGEVDPAAPDALDRLARLSGGIPETAS